MTKKDRVLRTIALSVGGVYPGALIGGWLGNNLVGAVVGCAIAAVYVWFRF